MATFFGEIGALSSRAVDDEEADSEPTYNISLDCKSKSESKTDCKLLLLAVGDLAIAFSKSYLISDTSTHLFDVKYSAVKAEFDSIMYTGGALPSSRSQKAASAYQVSKDVIVCEVPALVPEEINMDVCLMVLDHINCQEGVCITSKHMANFKSSEPVESYTPFIKALATSKFSRSHAMDKLQAPNFISGFAAAFLAEFQVKNKAALCVINFVDTDFLDSSNVQMFERLQEVDLNVKIDFATDAKAKLTKYIKARHCIESNLYT
ncbi:hypothetical protein JTE90_007218 [Oedothorax gibbosus]|uniref:Proteasome assembly chaperone 1 n=1 Tax=Oedothorax gibbosus TaxID=931172 RepID=A0AAV6VLL4_9ARAC|nr:hypothetical protein JTE90_007218 [Oedothorax gibbosus]